MPPLAQGFLQTITPEQIAALGATGVLALVVILMLRGELITKRAHEAVLERCDAELAKSEERGDRWQAVALEALNVTESAVGRDR